MADSNVRKTHHDWHGLRALDALLCDIVVHIIIIVVASEYCRHRRLSIKYDFFVMEFSGGICSEHRHRRANSVPLHLLLHTRARMRGKVVHPR